MRSCPVLIWLVADQVDGATCTLGQAASLLRQKREQILESVLGQGSKALVRLLTKLRPLKCDLQEIRLVYQLLRQAATLGNLRHCRSIHLPLLPTVMETTELADLPLVRELLQHPGTSVFCLKRVQMLMSGCRALTRNRDRADLWLRLSRCRTLKELEAMHQQLTNRFNSRLIRYRVRPAKEIHALAALNAGFKSMPEQSQQQEQTNQDRPVAGCMVGQEPVSPRGQQQGRSKRA